MLNNILNMEGVSVLNKKQQSQVKGSGTCAVMLGGYGGAVFTGLSKAHAMRVMAANGGRWCCDSCGSASWL